MAPSPVFRGRGFFYPGRLGHLARRRHARNRSDMWRRRNRVELREVLALLDGLGLLLMSIDSNVRDIVILLRGDDEEADA